MKVANNVVTINKLLILLCITLCLCKCIDSKEKGSHETEVVQADQNGFSRVGSKVLTKVGSRLMSRGFKKVFSKDDIDIVRPTRSRDSVRYADDSLITKVGKENKVSFLLRGLHSAAQNKIFEDAKKGLDPEQLDGESWWEDLTDDQVIRATCDHSTGRLELKTCLKAVEIALNMKAEEKAAIANALRRLPKNGKPWRLLYLKLFEAGINTVEEKQIDTLLDSGINMMAKTPPSFAAVRAIDMGIKAKTRYDEKRLRSNSNP